MKIKSILATAAVAFTTAVGGAAIATPFAPLGGAFDQLTGAAACHPDLEKREASLWTWKVGEALDVPVTAGIRTFERVGTWKDMASGTCPSPVAS